MADAASEKGAATTPTRHVFYVKKGGSGRVHHMANCSGGLDPSDAKKVLLTIGQLVTLMAPDADRSKRICPCAQRRAAKLIAGHLPASY